MKTSLKKNNKFWTVALAVIVSISCILGIWTVVYAQEQKSEAPTKNEAVQTEVEVNVRYIFEDEKVFKEEKIKAEKGQLIDSGDLPMLPDDMKFIDEFLFYEVKGDGKDEIIRKVAKMEVKDKETQTELSKDDISQIEKEAKELQDKLDKLNCELKDKDKLSDKQKNKIKDLEDEIAGLSTRIDKIKAEVDELKSAIAGKRVEIETAKASVEKYKSQQDNVRNNREYDFLTKEIEFQSLEIELCEKRIKEFSADREEKEAEVVKNEQILSERQKDLEQKKGELDEIISETKQEEEKLRDKAKDLETKIEPRLLQSFKRIRKNSRNGLGVVYVQRDACGGCFNKIPPQRQLDIRSRKKVIVCEYCGRIMIDPELAGVQIEHKVEEAPATTTKRAIRRKTAE